MAKGDSGETQTLINQQQGTSQGQQNQNIGQIQNLYNGLLNNYNTSLNPNRGLGGGPTNSAPTAGAQQFNPSSGQFGDLTQPNNWMGLVSNPQQLDSFVKSGLGSQANNQQLVDYYKTKIQGQPGANPTEQTGSAQYWMQKLQNDPNVTGQQSSGGGGISSLSGFQNFADTGGLSAQQQSDIRARDIAPTRAIYQNAMNDLDTQKALTGGYMPNYAAAQSDLLRKMNYGINDANTNANASIAGMIQSGKLAGLQGLLGSQNMFGNQALAANSQNLQNTALQNQLASLLINGKLGQSQLPGNFQQGAGNVATGMNMVGAGANIINGLLGSKTASGKGANVPFGTPEPGGAQSNVNLNQIWNSLSGQNFNNANNGAGLGNVQSGFPSNMGNPNSPDYSYNGIDPNTGLSGGYNGGGGYNGSGGNFNMNGGGGFGGDIGGFGVNGNGIGGSSYNSDYGSPGLTGMNFNGYTGQPSQFGIDPYNAQDFYA